MEKRKSKKDFFVRQLVQDKIDFHQLSENISAFEKAEIRRLALEKITKTKLFHIGNFSFGAETVANRNCENLIGGAQIPLGVAGPIKIRGQFAKGEFYLPLATTEGALVASVNRGCKAIREAGGVVCLAEDVGMSRAPVFLTENLLAAKNFVNWAEKNFQKIAKITEASSKHLKLLRLDHWIVGRAVYLRFVFNTDEAMGMNMVTIAVDKAIRELIEPATKARCVSLTGNLCVDKKVSCLNFILGRGKKIWAEVILPRSAVRRILKTTPQNFFEVWRLKVEVGSNVAGIFGSNAHFANTIAALFVACGQDLAHIVEGSLGVTNCEVLEKNSLYFSIYLPDLPIGTVGGGTGLATQQEALSMLGVLPEQSKKGAMKFAEIIGGAVLAGELSLLAALASGDLAKAHARLGQGKK